MDAEPKLDASEQALQKQEELFLRLAPESELEERVAQQIALCGAKLAQLERVLTHAESRLKTLHQASRSEL